MKYALITGGSRGIGRSVSIKLAAMGYTVLINYQSNDKEAANRTPTRSIRNNSSRTLKDYTRTNRETNSQRIRISNLPTDNMESTARLVRQPMP